MDRIKYPHQEYLRSRLNYAADIGVFIWKSREESSFNIKQHNGNCCKTWNSRFAGNIAGCTNRGYVVIRIDGVIYQAHKLAYIYQYGDAPFDDIDHINRNTLDNRIVNLRNVSRSENMQNTWLQKNNTSGIKGVSFDRRLRKWHAYIKVNSVRINLGLFCDLYDAAKVRYDAEVLYGFTKINPHSTAYNHLITAN